VSKAQLHLDATRAEKTKREEQAEHAALQAYAARSAATEAETMASELMADVEVSASPSRFSLRRFLNRARKRQWD
jgi:hypothetical protein